jgi:hypothetical protein
MKFSQIPTNPAPALTDFLIGVSSGNVDQKTTLSALAAIFGANLPNDIISLLKLDFSTFAEKLVLPANYNAATGVAFVPQDIAGSSVTVTIPAGYTVEISFGCGYQAGSNTEHDIVLWDTTANIGLRSAVSTTIGHALHNAVYQTPGSTQTKSFRLRASGNSGNFDFRELYIKTRLLKLS